MREPVASSRPGGIGGLRNAGRQTVVAGGRLICPRSRPATQVSPDDGRRVSSNTPSAARQRPRGRPDRTNGIN